MLAGDFHWTPGFINVTPTLTDLFFYDAASGHEEMYRSDLLPDGTNSTILVPTTVTSDSLPQNASSVVAGNLEDLEIPISLSMKGALAD